MGKTRKQNDFHVRFISLRRSSVIQSTYASNSFFMFLPYSICHDEMLVYLQMHYKIWASGRALRITGHIEKKGLYPKVTLVPLYLPELCERISLLIGLIDIKKKALKLHILVTFLWGDKWMIDERFHFFLLGFWLEGIKDW